ncbi:MAG: SymE family type I addiction module toxin [Chitinophagaceae bacterium]
METGVLLSQAFQAIAMQSEAQEQKIKTLKIQPLVRVHRWSDNTTVPEIRLSGAWLQKLGFCYGEKVEVRMSAGILVITPVAANCS